MVHYSHRYCRIIRYEFGWMVLEELYALTKLSLYNIKDY
jgi:hypothetical protein